MQSRQQIGVLIKTIEEFKSDVFVVFLNIQTVFLTLWEPPPPQNFNVFNVVMPVAGGHKIPRRQMLEALTLNSIIDAHMPNRRR